MKGKIPRFKFILWHKILHKESELEKFCLCAFHQTIKDDIHVIKNVEKNSSPRRQV